MTAMSNGHEFIGCGMRCPYMWASRDSALFPRNPASSRECSLHARCQWSINWFSKHFGRSAMNRVSITDRRNRCEGYRPNLEALTAMKCCHDHKNAVCCVDAIMEVVIMSQLHVLG